MKLNDLQCILLSGAAQRPDGCLWPLPDSVPEHAAARAIPPLLKKGLIEEKPAAHRQQSYRSGGDVHFSLHVTATGLHAIAVEPAPDCASIPPPEPTPRRPKGTLVLALLGREEGATMAELTAATGWLPHTVRAALSGLRKKGHAIDRSSREGVSFYHMAAAA